MLAVKLNFEFTSFHKSGVQRDHIQTNRMVYLLYLHHESNRCRAAAQMFWMFVEVAAFIKHAGKNTNKPSVCYYSTSTTTSASSFSRKSSCSISTSKARSISDLVIAAPLSSWLIFFLQLIPPLLFLLLLYHH